LAFSFQGDSQDEKDYWLEFAVPLGLEIDLAQEQQISLTSTLSGGFTEMMRRKGFETDHQLPLALKRKISKDSEFDYFLTGSMQRDESGYRVTASLHDMATGAVANRYEVANESLFLLVDTLSQQLRSGVGLTESENLGSKDLSIEELTTSDMGAFQLLIDALRASTFDQDEKEAIAKIDRAILKDPTFAIAYFRKANLLTLYSRWAELPQTLEAVRPHDYRLTEQDRFVLRTIQLWLVDKKPTLALQAMEQWLALHPRDVVGLQITLNLKVGLSDYKGALEALDALDRIETKLGYTAARAKLLQALGRFEEAHAAYNQYVTSSPSDLRGHLGMARTSEYLGDLDAAIEAYNMALVEDPSSAIVHRQFAALLYKLGRYEDAERHLKSMVSDSQTPHEMALSHQAVAAYHFYRGRTAKAVESLTSAWSILEKTKSPLEMHEIRLQSAASLATAGRTKEALQSIADARAAMLIGGDDAGAYKFYVFAAVAYSELGENELATRAMKAADVIGEALSFDMRWEEPLRAFIDQREGRNAEAAATYRAYLTGNPWDTQARRRLAEAEYGLGHLDEALAEVNEVLRRAPAQPLAHCLLGKILSSKGQEKEARAQVARAMNSWQKSDSDFAPKRSCVQ